MTDSNDKASERIIDCTSYDWQDREAYYPWVKLSFMYNGVRNPLSMVYVLRHTEEKSASEQLGDKIWFYNLCAAEDGFEGTITYEVQVPAPIRNV